MSDVLSSPLSARAREIVVAARELLEGEGPDAVSMRRIADRIGIKAPSLYKHFPDKSAVENALIAQGMAELAEALEAVEVADGPGDRGADGVVGGAGGAGAGSRAGGPAAGGGSSGAASAGRVADVVRGEGRIAALAGAYRAYALAHPDLYRLMSDRPLDRGALPAGLEARAAAPLVRAVGGDADAARAVWGFAHGMVALELAGRFPPGADLSGAWTKGCGAFSAYPTAI
ncbi:TetR/AcrR family transcriptional regulator [Embleya sp. NPDC050154]|uniref:TetR/AcrR family transcriptional regulator n=1 Tax=unclassified Embleya TaxID=2699296 RepID=UPI0037BB3FD9